MSILTSILITLCSALLWRVRGGLRVYKGHKVPFNKVWYALFLGFIGYFLVESTINMFIVSFLAGYTSYQLYGWGTYIGRLTAGGSLDPESDEGKECELIDNILFPLHITLKGTKYYVYQYPRLFGFLGTCLTGLIISFIWGLCFTNIPLMLSGVMMGVSYSIGTLLNKIKPTYKGGWNLGEWVDGAVKGFFLVLCLGGL